MTPNPKGFTASETEPEVRKVTLMICDLCLNGRGGICWCPGCAFWASAAPDVPISIEAAPPTAPKEAGE